MNAIHDETQLRTALTDAAESSGLSLDTDAILRHGHRKVRGRQLGIAAGAAAAAIAVALSFSLGGRPTAAPVPANPTDISSIAPGTFSGKPSAPTPGVSVELTVATHGATATETWVINGTTVTREVPAPTPGWITMLPDDLNPSKDLTAFAVYTGPVEHPVTAREMWEPDAYERIAARNSTNQDSMGGSWGQLKDSKGQAVGTVGYMSGGRSSDSMGLAWEQSWVSGDTNTVHSAGVSMALRHDRPVDAVPAATVRISPNSAVVLWRSNDSFGVGGTPLATSPKQPGDLKAAARTTSPESEAQEMVIGWVRGDAEVKVQSASSADGAFTVAVSEPKDGWRAFTAIPTSKQVNGPVTVTAGQLSTTVTNWQGDAAPGGQTAPPATTASTN